MEVKLYATDHELGGSMLIFKSVPYFAFQNSCLRGIPILPLLKIAIQTTDDMILITNCFFVGRKIV